jgi:Methyltransferase domain
MMTRLTQHLKYSPLSRLATLPLRVKACATPLAGQTWQTLIWLLRSREWANFSYDYSAEGEQAMLCAIHILTGHPMAALMVYAQELRTDTVFAQRYAQRVQDTRLRHTSDPELRFGRCLVNYILVRARRPKTVFEAGTERGLSTWSMCRALHRNLAEGHTTDLGRIITVDIGQDRGEFLEGDEDGLVQRLVGDSVQALRNSSGPIDLFLHDTVNQADHTREQLNLLAPRLSRGAVVHSCWFSLEFAQFCDQHGLNGLELVEKPKDHWYAGRRCGLAVKP